MIVSNAHIIVHYSLTSPAYWGASLIKVNLWLYSFSNFISYQRHTKSIAYRKMPFPFIITMDWGWCNYLEYFLPRVCRTTVLRPSINTVVRCKDEQEKGLPSSHFYYPTLLICTKIAQGRNSASAFCPRFWPPLVEMAVQSSENHLLAKW